MPHQGWFSSAPHLGHWASEVTEPPTHLHPTPVTHLFGVWVWSEADHDGLQILGCPVRVGSAVLPNLATEPPTHPQTYTCNTPAWCLGLKRCRSWRASAPRMCRQGWFCSAPHWGRSRSMCRASPHPPKLPGEGGLLAPLQASLRQAPAGCLWRCGQLQDHQGNWHEA